jgi:hypothetical protein
MSSVTGWRGVVTPPGKKFKGMTIHQSFEPESWRTTISVQHKESGSSSRVLKISGTSVEQTELEIVKAIVTLANELADELKVYSKLEGEE